MNDAGDNVTQDFVGLWATSVQHQIDHLAGCMFFDRLSRTKRDMLLKKVRKSQRLSGHFVRLRAVATVPISPCVQKHRHFPLRQFTKAVPRIARLY